MLKKAQQSTKRKKIYIGLLDTINNLYLHIPPPCFLHVLTKKFMKPPPKIINSTSSNQDIAEINDFKPWRLIGFILILLLAISFWLKWYTGAVSIPRYCDNPSDAMYYLKKVLTEKTPAKNESRRPYLIAAKLIYIIPQLRDESIPDYLARLRVRIAEQCR